MKYDDAEFCFLNFETELDNNAANTHIGMYLGWAVLRGLGREDPKDEAWTEAVARLKRREITGGDLLGDRCDCKLMDFDLNAQGNAFTAAYYEKQFVKDYEKVLGKQMPDTGHPNDDFCSVPDTWANFDQLAPLLDRRFEAWKAQAGGGKQSDNDSDSGLSLAPLDGGRDTLESLQQRSAAGDRDALYHLGAEYLTGERVPRDFVKAADAFEKAAQLGLPAAAFNLGVCYQNGDGRPKDAKQMLRWFTFAAEGGHGQAAYFLGMAYRQGEHLQQDFVASNALILLAKARGVKAAAEAGVMAGSLPESMALATQLSEPGQLVATLSARRRAVAAGKADDGVARWRDPAGRSTPKPAGNSSRSSGKSSRSAKPPHRGIGLGHLALLFGAVALVPLLLAAPALAGRGLRGLAALFSLVGAGGVYVVSGRLGKSIGLRVLMTLLAAVPFIGSLICIAVTWEWLRARGKR